MKAIVTRNPKFSGTCFDTFEYFYCAWELDNSVKLISKHPQLSSDFILKKYDINPKCLKNIIIDEPLNYDLQSALIFDTHCFPSELKYKKITIISNSEKRFKNATHFSEFFLDKNYTHKLNFKIMRKFEHKNQTYINAMDTSNLKIYQIMQKFKPYILKNPMSAFQNYTQTNFTPDFYKEFDKFVYIKTPNTFDRHPRMFNECEFQNIKCFYFNLSQNLDPSWFRFNDRHDLQKRELNENDSALQNFLLENV